MSVINPAKNPSKVWSCIKNNKNPFYKVTLGKKAKKQTLPRQFETLTDGADILESSANGPKFSILCLG